MAKINPNIIKDEKAQNKLIDYQLKAKDVLSKAFIKSYNTPKTFSEALLLASNLQEKLECQKPKVEMYDTLMESEGLMNFKQIADSFNICGRNTLMKILREERILCSRKYNKNLPYSQYSKNGYFEVKVTPRRTNNGVEKFCTTLCTNKSLKLIQKILKKKGLLPTTQIANI